MWTMAYLWTFTTKSQLHALCELWELVSGAFPSKFQHIPSKFQPNGPSMLSYQLDFVSSSGFLAFADFFAFFLGFCETETCYDDCTPALWGVNSNIRFRHNLKATRNFSIQFH
jgi:hypothetical protein